MTRWRMFWALHYAFLLGVSVTADYAAILGPEYAVPARLYFVIGNLVAVILCCWPLFRQKHT